MAAGKLYIVATPIGNLEDITIRALKVLLTVRHIGTETPARIRKLLSHYGISLKDKHIWVVREDRRENALHQIAKILDSGEDVCLVADAGTPGISDPGWGIVDELLRRGYMVVPIPGPSALTTALSAYPVRTPWVFLGFLPRRKGRRMKVLQEFIDKGVPVIFYESPHRIMDTLEMLGEIFDSTVEVCVCRELTKLHESIVVGLPKEVISSIPPKGEFVVIIRPLGE